MTTTDDQAKEIVRCILWLINAKTVDRPSAWSEREIGNAYAALVEALKKVTL